MDLGGYLMPRIWRRMLRKQYLVTLDTGEAFRGVLEEADRKSMVLQQVTYLKSDGSELPVDGRMILDRTRVAYAQEL